MRTKPFVTTGRVVSSDERDALVICGMPERPFVVPIAAVDFEPLHDSKNNAYRLTMDLETAVDLGFYL